jgi:ribose/xylose/arabinose/galactoside ABC-type transport system permease subunit
MTETTRNRWSPVALIPKHNATISAAILVLVVLIFLVATQGLIVSAGSLNLLATFGPEIILMTLGMGLVLLVGQIDLSVGSMYIASSVVFAGLFRYLEISPWLSVVAALLAGVLLGLVNGLLVVTTRISSFIVTLGTMWGFHGLMLVIFGATTIPIYRQPDVFNPHDLFAGRLLGLPTQVIWLLVIVVTLALVRNRTRFGVRMQAVGSNVRAAKMMGLPTRLVTISAFTISGALAGLAGVIRASQSSQAVPQSGEGVMLMVLAGAIIGGVSLAGGKGDVVGPFLGGVTLLVISTGFVMMGVVEFWTNILIAVAVIATAVAFDRLEALRVRRSIR